MLLFDPFDDINMSCIFIYIIQIKIIHVNTIIKI